MLVFDEVLIRCRVERLDLNLWIERDWIRPTRDNDDWHFGDQDLARVELICDLVRDLRVPARPGGPRRSENSDSVLERARPAEPGSVCPV